MELDNQALSHQERDRLRELEGVIERGLKTFLEVGAALLEIRTNRLYRQGYSTFESYLRDRWAISISRANQLILSMQAAQNLIEPRVIDEQDAADKPETLFRPLSRVSPELAIGEQLSRTPPSDP